jgi:hypothetical protein
MVNAIAVAAPVLSGENSIVLYQHILPERYADVFPSVEFIPPEDSHSTSEGQAGSEVLYYDRQGRIQRLFQKGELVNTLF